MASVVYTGWETREAREDHGGVMSCQLKKSVNLPDGGRLVFRGRAGKKSRPHQIEDRHTLDLFRDHSDFEVRE